MNRFFRWYGGKIRMLEKLEALIPEHKFIWSLLLAPER